MPVPIRGGGVAQRVLWITAAAGLALDQVTKAVAAVVVEGHPPSHVLGGHVTFTAYRNSGAAGSFAPRATLVFTVLAIGVLAFIARTAPTVRTRGWALGLGLIFAGAGGNLADRIFRTPGFGRGAVLDFIQVGHGGIFNLSDQCVMAGVVTVMVQLLRGVPLGSAQPPPDAAPATCGGPRL
ncbi:signal peptidase II [Streptomyces cocklensis]|uniref:Lipoprotein signal peptidase n=1 Tax=Actinacidiphila cocklensis TaxID=887465 RepID=A0A9W4DJC0_9ACTN|nr:signal peptidase II [Actinacidiphila cocklensis]MDD1061940.1 signal peptidase II [Actinacidiphila cocklensis]WSX74683.1 signal peptidase II [Streptomyces sp. NBC_00899]CAG6391269.1 Lipoprotein signal peptidase [Actinacidiphila cocklensis]